MPHALDEVERLQHAVLAPADDVETSVPPARVDVLWPDAEVDACGLRVGSEPVLLGRPIASSTAGATTPPCSPVSTTISVGASAPSPTAAEITFRPRTPSRSCGIPLFVPGPSSIQKSGIARATSTAEVATATIAGAA